MFRLGARKIVLSPRNPIAKSTSSITALQAAFRDRNSPFYLAPGEQGPESPDSSILPQNHLGAPALENDPEPISINPYKEAHEELERKGFDPQSFWKQPIAWGDQDPFRHVNNARYFRFFESGRMKWIVALGEELGGPSKARAMLDGIGVSLILKSIEINFRRPVTYPDNLLIGYKVLSSGNEGDPSTFHVAASAYSLAQKAFVAHSKEALVWYDYDKLRKVTPEAKTLEILRCKLGETMAEMIPEFNIIKDG